MHSLFFLIFFYIRTKSSLSFIHLMSYLISSGPRHINFLSKKCRCPLLRNKYIWLHLPKPTPWFYFHPENKKKWMRSLPWNFSLILRISFSNDERQNVCHWSSRVTWVNFTPVTYVWHWFKSEKKKSHYLTRKRRDYIVEKFSFDIITFRSRREKWQADNVFRVRHTLF